MIDSDFIGPLKPRSKIWHFGMWQIPYKATNVLCADGHYRTFKLSSEPDTFWTIGARCSYRGTTVTGFISGGEDDMVFHATGKHKDIFGEFPNMPPKYWR